MVELVSANQQCRMDCPKMIKTLFRPVKKWSTFILLKMLEFQIRIIRQIPFGSEIITKHIERIWNSFTTLRSSTGTFKLYTPTDLTRFRATTMFTKEPETIAWLNDLPQSSTFWDIGANVGIFSIYAAKTKLATVIAVEPSNLNL